MAGIELDEAYAEHAASVFAFALSLTRAEAEAREVVQEVFCKLAVRRMGKPIAELRSYMLRMTHCCVIDRVRSEGARQRAAARLSAENSTWFAPALDADTTAFRQALTGALAELPSDQRAVVHLKLWEGLTFGEIANLLGLPLNTAASRYRYGLEKLRTTLLPLYEEIRHLPAP